MWAQHRQLNLDILWRHTTSGDWQACDVVRISKSSDRVCASAGDNAAGPWFLPGMDAYGMHPFNSRLRAGQPSSASSPSSVGFISVYRVCSWIDAMVKIISVGLIAVIADDMVFLQLKVLKITEEQQKKLEAESTPEDEKRSRSALYSVSWVPWCGS